ncbi:MAG: ABC transporter permease [Firmicutes bacterium]|nr:ABC transporter permease [Bacillota bacterium]
MFKYAGKRIGLGLLNLFVIILLCFVLVKNLEVVRETAASIDPERDPYLHARMVARGYFDPLMVQFWRYITNIIFHWDFGVSMSMFRGREVTEIYSTRLPPSMIMNFGSTLIATPIALVLGVFAALKKNKWQDHFVSTIVILLISVPVFVSGFALQYFLAFRWDIFPVWAPPLMEDDSWFRWAMIWPLVLPMIILALPTIASLTRNTRAELTEQLTADYTLLARTKGLSVTQTTVRHSFKNAMVLFIPVIIISFVANFTGSIIVERMFNIQGVGSLMLESIETLDYSLFMFGTVFYTSLGLLFSIIADLMYGLIDPRIRMGARR